MTSRLQVKRKDVLLISAFYAAIGIAQMAVLAISDFRLVTSGALALLSLVAAYVTFKVEKWAVWLIVGLSFPHVVFGVATLYSSIVLYSFYQDPNLLLLDTFLILSIILSLISLAYVVAKRKTFQQI